MEQLWLLSLGGTANKFTNWTFVFVSLLKANYLCNEGILP